MPTIPRRQTPAPRPLDDGRRDTPQDKRYWSTAWRRARVGFIAKHPTCNSCGRTATVVDHITPVTMGGEFWDRNNWQPLCESCHNRKSSGERKNLSRGRG